MKRLVEIAQETGLCRDTLRRHIREGKLLAYDFGGHYRVTEENYAKWLKAHEAAPSSDPMRPPKPRAVPSDTVAEIVDLELARRAS